MSFVSPLPQCQLQATCCLSSLKKSPRQSTRTTLVSRLVTLLLMTILTTVMTKAVVRSFLPKMSPTGRITNIGSNFGLVDRICGDEPFSSQLRQAFTDPELTEKELDRLVNSFTQDVKVGEIWEDQ